MPLRCMPNPGPIARRVRDEFPGTEYTLGPSLRVTWIDAAGARPPREQLGEIPAGYELPAAGSVLVGENGSMVIPHVDMPKLFPEEKFPASSLPIIDGVDHYTQWADACRGVGETTSNFDYSAPLSEAVLLGTIGIRFPGQELLWDAQAQNITNHPQAQDWTTKRYRPGWEPAFS